MAEDIVQEVFLKVWQNRNSLKVNTSFKSYLFTIALNTIRKHFNKASKFMEIRHDILIDISNNREVLDNYGDFEVLLNKLELLILQMPPKRKRIFIANKIEGKTQKIIAEEFNISNKTVEYHISEAMKYLKSEFKKLNLQGLIFFHLFLSNKNSSFLT